MIPKGKALTLILTLFYFCAQGAVSFRHWDEATGLPNDEIRDFTALDDGRMAIRIPQGVMIFDGSAFHLHPIDRAKEKSIGYFQQNVFTDYKDPRGRLWLKSPRHLSVFDPSSGRVIYNVDSLLLADYGMPPTELQDFYLDANHRMWLLTADHRLMLAEQDKKPLLIARTDGTWQTQSGTIIQIEASKETTDFITSKGVIKTWDNHRRQFTATDDNFRGQIDNPNHKFLMLTDTRGRKWAIHGQKLWLREPGLPWKVMLEISGGSNFFTALCQTPEGDIWAAASWSGLRIIDGRSLQITHYPSLPIESGGSITNDIQQIYADPTGGMWVATLWQGVAYYHSKMHPFHTFHTHEAPKSRSNESVRAFTELPDGSLLLATSFNGVMHLDPASGSLTPYRPDLFPASDVYLCIYRDSKSNIWVGSYIHGLTCVAPDGSSRLYNHIERRPTNISRAILEDPQGRYWVSVRDMGVGQLDPQSGQIKLIADANPRLGKNRREVGIFQFNDQEICVYGDHGSYLYNPVSGKLFVTTEDARPSHKFNVSCNAALTDSRGLSWWATDQGVVISDPEAYPNPDYAPTRLNTSNSLLPSDFVAALTEDRFGQIWLAVAGALVRVAVHPAHDNTWTYELTTYPYGAGLSAGRVSQNGLYTSAAGDIYIGGFNGVSRFNPVELGAMKERPTATPIITGLHLLDHKVAPGENIDGRTLLHTALLNDQELRLRHDENFITLDFSSLDYISGPNVHYKYRLRNYDSDWVELRAGETPRAYYTGLPPGRYTFEVMAAGLDGVWSPTPASCQLVIDPPFWQTWWAYVLYVALLAGAVAIFTVKYNERRERLLLQKAQQRETVQREQLNQMKFQFFTNVSHEFRTPLSMIITPLGQILKGDLEPPLRQKLQSVARNADSLLKEVNRLLDFRKLEMGGEKLTVARCRVAETVDYVISTFQPAADARRLSFPFICSIPADTDVWLDAPKLRHILTNLYSNAVKFTPDGGSITTTLAFEGDGPGKCLRVTVADTGCGIPREDLPKVFDRFFQAAANAQNPKGSGIGLHLTSEYVKLHGGQISVTSEPGHGSVFSFTIPLSLKATSSEPVDNSAEPAPEEAHAAPTDSRPKVMVVEDNPEFLDFLAEYLDPDYRVMKASDGQDAWDKIKDFDPDLIVTDLMMPRLDGLGLIQKVKHDIATSHIPVVLLTAKASDESRAEGYRAGADSYISKPFNYDVLEARVKMLLQQASRRKKSFRRDAEIEPSAVTIASVDEKIVKKALETVEQNMDNTQFSTLQLGEALGLSRSQLYRKFESITGMSPADFILRMRLKRAAQLLRDSSLNVSEIADMTGFNSIKYFNKHFKEEFSMTPTAYRASQKQPAEA